MTSTSSFGVSRREGHDARKFYARGLVEADQDLDSTPSTPTRSALNQLYQKDSRRMGEVGDNCVSLMVTSPPYHVGKDYDTDDPFDDYLDLLYAVFEETFRVLEPGGRAAVNVAGLGRKPYLSLSTYVDAIMLDIGYLPRGEIIWQKAEGASGSCAWGTFRSPRNPVLRDIHEKILVFSKGRFDRHPSKGKEATADKEEFMRDTLSVWKIPPASAKRIGHAAPFPVELPRRLINLYTFPGDLVLDPFIGSGTTAIAAKLTGRNYVGYDNDKASIDLAHERIKNET